MKLFSEIKIRVIKKVDSDNQIVIETIGNNTMTVIASSDDGFSKAVRGPLRHIIINHKGREEAIAININIWGRSHAGSPYCCVLKIPKNIEEVKDSLEFFMFPNGVVSLSVDCLSLTIDKKEYLWSKPSESLVYRELFINAVIDGAIIINNPDELLKFAVGKITEEELKKFISEPTLVEKFVKLQEEIMNLKRENETLQ